MSALDPLFLWIGTNLTSETYMILTKIQGILWSIADIVIVFFLLKIAGLARKKMGRGKILMRYYLLLVSGTLTPLLILTRTPRHFLLLETVICGIQFTILVYTIIMEKESLLQIIGEYTGKKPR